MEQLLTTYKYYDNRKRRLSIFGEEVKMFTLGEFDPLPTKDSTDYKTELIITVFTCSKKDTFSKKRSQELYKLFVKNGRQPFTITTSKTIRKFNPQTENIDESIEIIEEYIHPQVFHVNCEEGKTKVPFIEWCKKTYKKEFNLDVIIPDEGVSILNVKNNIAHNTFGEKINVIKIKGLW